jgi:hypothetical protein
MARGRRVAINYPFEKAGKILPTAFCGGQKYDAAVKEGVEKRMEERKLYGLVGGGGIEYEVS